MSSSSDDDDDRLVYDIGKTDPETWVQDVKAYLHGKYTPVTGDHGAALEKQKATIVGRIKGRREAEVSAWADEPDEDLIPVSSRATTQTAQKQSSHGTVAQSSKFRWV